MEAAWRLSAAAWGRRYGGIGAAKGRCRGGVRAAWPSCGGSAAAECRGVKATLRRRGGRAGEAWRRRGGGVEAV